MIAWHWVRLIRPLNKLSSTRRAKQSENKAMRDCADSTSFHLAAIKTMCRNGLWWENVVVWLWIMEPDGSKEALESNNSNLWLFSDDQIARASYIYDNTMLDFGMKYVNFKFHFFCYARRPPTRKKKHIECVRLSEYATTVRRISNFVW